MIGTQEWRNNLIQQPWLYTCKTLTLVVEDGHADRSTTEAPIMEQIQEQK